MELTFTGIVERGMGRAARLGFPTVNITLADLSLSGIYAAEVRVPGGVLHDAVAFADPNRKLLEAHLLDFAEDAYGKEVTITLKKKLRDSRMVADDAELVRMIAEDVENVKRYFSAARAGAQSGN